MTGKLVLCATPIGNLDDMSPRAVETLRNAGLIACEDTRRIRKLLSHFGVPTPELSVYNEATERRRSAELVELIAAGRTVVLVSDAGMPALSDPGYRLVKACADRGLDVEIVPGPNAAVSALAVSGLPPGRFVFEGFLPRRSSERTRHLEELKDEPRTLVFYESPHRIAGFFEDAAATLGDRQAALVRELTKMHEEVRRGTLAELAISVAEVPPKGEMVIVVQGATHDADGDVDPASLAAAARALMADGVPRSEALQQVARELGVAKRRVFDALLDK